uniref:Putative secreted protein fat body overexpressed n=1 Tax=Rhipicephalus microplus TaxID=6941 RepID=A0A6M2DBD0_RHIMP
MHQATACKLLYLLCIRSFNGHYIGRVFPGYVVVSSFVISHAISPSPSIYSFTRVGVVFSQVRMKTFELIPSNISW